MHACECNVLAICLHCVEIAGYKIIWFFLFVLARGSYVYIRSICRIEASISISIELFEYRGIFMNLCGPLVCTYPNAIYMYDVRRFWKARTHLNISHLHMHANGIASTLFTCENNGKYLKLTVAWAPEKKCICSFGACNSFARTSWLPACWRYFLFFHPIAILEYMSAASAVFSRQLMVLHDALSIQNFLSASFAVSPVGDARAIEMVHQWPVAGWLVNRSTVMNVEARYVWMCSDSSSRIMDRQAEPILFLLSAKCK